MNWKIILLAVIFSISLFTPSNSQQEKHVKNVIMMIPDGTSLSVLSLARWYKYGICPADNACWLTMDKLICGLVKTHSSDAPIGDSAPTGSSYATGYLSHTGYIATYPKSSGKERDLVPIDPKKAYQPLFTILESAKINHKSTGLVVTCQFPHATPADFSAHTPHRDKYDLIAKQMVHNHINVVFGGGTKYLDPQKREDKENLVSVLKARNYQYVTKNEDFKKLRSSDSLVWGLFANDALPYDLDANKDSIPTLSEMTDKAIQILSNNKEGFFLMVEGSKVDWAAHNNDAVGMATEFLAFDKAVETALDFAKKDGNTAIVICPDHGNSGMSIGGPRTVKGYDTLSISSIITPLRNCRHTAEGLTEILVSLPEASTIPKVFMENTKINLTQEEQESLIASAKKGPGALDREIVKLYTNHSYIAFTTTGHTGEDVMLGNYHPHGYTLSGVVQNTAVNAYMQEILGGTSLNDLSDQYYCVDSVALKGYNFEITPSNISKTYSTLVIRKNAKSKKRAEINAYTDFVTIYDGKKELKKISLNSVAVFISEEKEKINRFYIPRLIGEMLQSEI
jgi:alkaline phosphatase